MRALIEVIHIAIGLAVAALLASLAAWSYPRATDDIWLVTYVAMAAVVLMGVRPLYRAFEVDRARLRREEQRKDG